MIPIKYSHEEHAFVRTTTEEIDESKSTPLPFPSFRAFKEEECVVCGNPYFRIKSGIKICKKCRHAWK